VPHPTATRLFGKNFVTPEFPAESTTCVGVTGLPSPVKFPVIGPVFSFFIRRKSAAVRSDVPRRAVPDCPFCRRAAMSFPSMSDLLHEENAQHADAIFPPQDNKIDSGK